MRSDSSAAFPSCRGGRLPPPCLGGWSSGAGKVAAPGPHPPVPSPLFRPPLLGARRRLRATSSAPSRTEARPEGLGRAPPRPRSSLRGPRGTSGQLSPSPSRDPDASFSERVLAREQAALPLVTTPAFHLRGSKAGWTLPGHHSPLISPQL